MWGAELAQRARNRAVTSCFLWLLDFFDGHVSRGKTVTLGYRFFLLVCVIGVVGGVGFRDFRVFCCGLGSVEQIGICQGHCPGIQRGTASVGLRPNQNLGNQGSRGSPARGKQSKQCHHSNWIAASGLTFCCKTCAIQVLLGHLNQSHAEPSAILAWKKSRVPP